LLPNRPTDLPHTTEWRQTKHVQLETEKTEEGSIASPLRTQKQTDVDG